MNDRKIRHDGDLTQGRILRKLMVVALPIMGTQLMQMGYNLTDMFWLGRVGPDAVAASGTAGQFMWLASAFLLFGRMGSEIGVSQSLGASDLASAKKFGTNSVQLSLLMGLLSALFLVIFRGPLIGFFNIQKASVAYDAQVYLAIVSVAMPVNFLVAAITGIFNGSGNSKTPFIANLIGLIANIVLDPVFIFAFRLGVVGAAVATTISQCIVGIVSFAAIKKSTCRPFNQFSLLGKIDRDILKRIFSWTIPIMLESLLFSIMSMLTTRFVNIYGSNAMAVSRVGTQVESLSWLVGGGFGSALTAFIGQNYGAGKWTRIHKCFNLSLCVMLLYGTFVTVILFAFAGQFYELFLPNEPVIRSMGIDYLTILAICQIPQCLEAITAGTLKGIGITTLPSVISISTNILRVILAYLVSTYSDMGLNGIWYVIMLTACLRGIGMTAFYVATNKNRPKIDIVYKKDKITADEAKIGAILFDSSNFG